VLRRTGAAIGRAEAFERGGGDVGQPLPGPHQVEVAVRADGEQLKHLVQHLSVLRGHADQRRDARRLRQALDDGRHLDCLRARAEYR
jgi:hypothetical protein